MKKLLIGILSATLLLTGCQSKTVQQQEHKQTTLKEEIKSNESLNKIKNKVIDIKNSEESKEIQQKVKDSLGKAKEHYGNKEITIANLDNNTKYNRKEFPHWREGITLKTVRDEILKRDGFGVSTTNGKVKSGVWKDFYSGQKIKNIKEIDIDHIFPLKRAWNSGASKWTLQQRENFANDPENLLSVSSKENREKGTKGPSEWLPSDSNYHKEYCEKYLYIAKKYGLTITQKDLDTINKILNK